ncbi:MAG: sensor histidine kinase [Actinobacteria bacterium]|nr:sensor histidine kinase [Actinomycetota bacterium]
MVDGPGARRSLRDWAVDACVSIVALAVGVAALYGSWETHGTVARVVDIALGLAAMAALWERRRHPVGVAAFVIPASAFSALAAGAGLVVLFNAAIRCDRRSLAWIAVASVAASLVYGLLYSTGAGDFLDNAVIGVLLFGFAIGWGLFVRVRRDLVHSLHERAAQLEEEGRLRADQARAAERERIAREMHDVLAHRLSILSLHAGALEYRPEAPPEELAATAGVVRDSAAAALEELRDVIGVLREGTESESRRPQPTLSDLPTLIEESRAAGMRIEASSALPEEDGNIGRTAYRVVQEGLTNARKHAPGVLVRVRVAESEDGLEIEIRNGAPISALAAPALPGAGSGLIGLGERVQLVGGELRHEVTANGDFVLTATLPLERDR